MNTEWLELLKQVLEVCVIPLLGVLTTFLVLYIKKRANELGEMTKNDISAKYINMLADTIVMCVQSTNQIYVDTLKKDNVFTKEAQVEAFNMTKNAVLAILSDEAKIYLEEAYGDLNEYISRQIEATVKELK